MNVSVRRKRSYSRGNNQIHLWYKNKRYRFANGRVIEEELLPNLLEEPEREHMAQLLCSAFQIAIAKGWRPLDKKKEAAEKKKRLSSIADVFLEQITIESLTLELIYDDDFLYSSY